MNLSSLCAALAMLAILPASAVAGGESSFVYRWEGDNKSIHITNKLGGVPEKYRGKASRMKAVTIESLDKILATGSAWVEGSGEISFDKSKIGLIVSSLINQKIKRNAIIDTGSEWVVITSKYARALGLDIKALRVGHFRAFGGSVKAPIVRLKSLRVGPAIAKNIDAAIIDFEGRGEVSAIIGMNFLSRFVFEIDHAKGKMTFYQLEK